MRLKTTLILTIIQSFLLCYSQPIVNRYGDNQFKYGDMLLMYYGNKYRLQWNEKEVLPLVMHTYKDGHSDWLFPSFLYLEFKTDKRGFGNEMAKGNSTKSDWEWLLNRMFARNEGLHALDKAINRAKQTLGNPPFRHQVVLMLPSPINEQQDWGSINNKRMNFKKQQDKLTAVKWFVDELLTRFNAQNYENISLSGLYWIEETSRTCSDVLPAISTYVHSKGLDFIWIPFYTARGRFDWKNLGFDYAYLQTGYFWKLDKSIDHIQEACSSAKRYGMGLEFEINEKYFSHRSSYASRMTTLLDEFQRQGVFESCGLTYYCGNKVLLDLCNSTLQSDKLTLDRLASIISARNQKLLNAHSSSSNTQPTQISTQPNNQSTPDKSGLDWRDPDYWHF